MNRSLVSVSFIFLFSFFLAPSLVSASPVPEGIICLQGKVVDCAAGNCGKNDSMDESQDCDLEELDKHLKKTRKGLAEATAKLGNLKDSVLENSKKMADLKLVLHQLQEVMISREDVSVLISQELRLTEENLNATIQGLIDMVADRFTENSVRISNLENWKKDHDELHHDFQVGITVNGLIATDGGLIGGAGLEVHIPLGTSGTWNFSGGGFAGYGSVSDVSKFAYGGQLSLLAQLGETGDVQFKGGPTLVAAVTDDLEIANFSSQLITAGFEAQVSSEYVSFSLTPLVGVGGSSTGPDARQMNVTAAMMAKVSLLPF